MTHEQFLKAVFNPGTKAEQKKRAELFIKMNPPEVVKRVAEWGRKHRGKK